MTTQRKTLSGFHREISWSTRIYLLMAVAVAVGMLIFPYWSVVMLFALAIVLFVESLTLSIQRHPATWRTIGWLLLLIMLALLLIAGR